jgi:hypothetical protein
LKFRTLSHRFLFPAKFFPPNFFSSFPFPAKFFRAQLQTHREAEEEIRRQEEEENRRLAEMREKLKTRSAKIVRRMSSTEPETEPEQGPEPETETEQGPEPETEPEQGPEAQSEQDLAPVPPQPEAVVEEESPDLVEPEQKPEMEELSQDPDVILEPETAEGPLEPEQADEHQVEGGELADKADEADPDQPEELPGEPETAAVEPQPEESGDQPEAVNEAAEAAPQADESGDVTAVSAEDDAAVPIPVPVDGTPPEMLPMSTQTDEEEPVPPIETECRETQVCVHYAMNARSRFYELVSGEIFGRISILLETVLA